VGSWLVDSSTRVRYFTKILALRTIHARLISFDNKPHSSPPSTQHLKPTTRLPFMMSTNYPPSISSFQAPTLAPSIAPSTTSSYPNPTQPSPLSTSTLPPSASNKNPFAFPSSYSFPPFFTRQPNTSTHHAQLQKWSSLVQAYCRHHRFFKLSLTDSLDSDLFHNKKIGKRLGREDAREVVEFMWKEGRAEWVVDDKGKTRGAGEGGEFWVWWRNVEEWAGLIAEWVSCACCFERYKGVALTWVG
jgi:ESCRT-II complex subunit VPS25